jgi:antitoxin component YwqK of YwqJK toxin-antitoxin module
MKKTLTLSLFLFFHIYLIAQQPFSSTLILEKGDSLQKEKKYKEAIDLYQQIYINDTNYHRGIYETSVCYYADSQFNKALEVSSYGLTLQSEERPSLYNLQGNILDDMGKPQQAMLYYDSAISIYPQYVSPYINKATLQLRQKKFAEAESFLQQAAFIFPYSASVHYKLGIAAINQGKLIQGFLSITHSLLVEPSNGNLQNAVAILSSMSKGDDEILGYYQSRKVEADANYQQAEELFLSKLALDKAYKSETDLKDPITSQLQMIIEKLEYTPDDKDFYVQYFLPVLKEILKEKKYNAYCNHIFSGLKIKQIEEYYKKSKKEATQMVDGCIVYFNKVRISREWFAEKRNADGPYHYENGKCFAKGKYINEKTLGPWEFYYSNGNIRTKGVFDDNGERTGEWIYYYENLAVSGKENYTGGKLNGDEIVLNANGTKTRVAGYVNGSKEGENHDYYANGNLRSIEVYANGKESGTLNYYFNEGPVRTTLEAKDGKNEGSLVKYYLNGRIEQSAFYKDGKQDGNTKSYHENGNLFSEGNYAAGEPDGEWKYYYENGKIKSEQTFVNGEIEGVFTEYYDNGNVSYKQFYKKGKAEGECIFYSREGKLFSKMIFNNGKLKEAAYFDATGKEISRSVARGKNYLIEIFRPDGTKKSVGKYNDKAVSHGTETNYWGSGAVLSELNYEEGSLQGPGTFYFNNGKKEQELNYEAGIKNGLFREYYKHGGLYVEGIYKDNLSDGLWIYYDHAGKVEQKAFFIEGDKHGIRESYYPDGKTEFREEFSYGSLIAYTQYDTAGKILVSNRWEKGSGKFINRHFNGNIASEGTMLNGYLHGAFQSKYFDGKITSKEFYYHGLPDSNYQLYFHNGNIQQEGKYFRGKKTGIWKYYFESGKLYMQEEWIGGQLHGNRTYYFENGKVETEMPYYFDKKEGWLLKYNEEGMLINKVRYVDGEPVEYSYEDKNGNDVKPIQLPGGTGSMKTFYRNGNPSSILNFIDGDLNGHVQYFHSNGKPSWEATEAFNLTEGPGTSYYPNGKIRYRFQYLHNNYHGLYQEFYQNGMIMEEGNYDQDRKHGQWKKFDENGVLKETRTYYYGRLIQCK